MKKNKDEDNEIRNNNLESKKISLFKSKTIKDVIAPAGMDASNLNHLERM